MPMETPRQLESLHVALVRSGTHYPDGVLARVVQRERLMIALSTDHPPARSRALKPAQPRGQPFISPQFGEVDGMVKYLAKLGVSAGSTPNPTIR